MHKKSHKKITIKPKFSLFDIQVAVGDGEFNKGSKLFTDNKVGKITADLDSFHAQVSGTHDYDVSVNASNFERGFCTCYLGQKDILCKHMLALAIATISEYDAENFNLVAIPLDHAICSGEVREITKEELTAVKAELRHGLSFIKYYNGPSSKWFAYQNALQKGGRLIRHALSKLPVCEVSAKLCIDYLIKLDKKVCYGVDDSDGTVGDLMTDMVEVLDMFVDADMRPDLRDFITKNLPDETCFDWPKMFGII